MKRSLLALALLACVAAPAAWAATPINETRPLDPRGRIEIENLKGRIQIRTWNKPEVHIGGSLGKGVEKLVIEGDEGDLTVRVEYPKRSSGWGGDNKTEPTDLILNVPVLADLDIESVSADVDVVGIAGTSLDIDAVSGDVTVAGAPQEASIESVSGDLNLTLNSREVSAESVSGDIFLQGRMDGEMHVETVSGQIDANSKGQRLRQVSVGTVSGDADVRVVLDRAGNLKAETVSGDLKIRLPKSLSARATGESFSGDLSATGLSESEIERPKYGPGSSFEHRYGNGDGVIRIETFSGDAALILE
jgi:hypothetical protein